MLTIMNGAKITSKTYLKGKIFKIRTKKYFLSLLAGGDVWNFHSRLVEAYTNLALNVRLSQNM
jgi:hypothetical protein